MEFRELVLMAFGVPIATTVAAGVITYRVKKNSHAVGVYIPLVQAFKWGSILAVVSLIWLIGWIVWYERSTRYSAGNAPVGWLVFYGPLSFGCGQVLGLAMWFLGERKKLTKTKQRL